MEPGIDGTTSGDLPQADTSDMATSGSVVLTPARARGHTCTRTLVSPTPHDEETSVQGYWPLRSYMELGALSGAVPCARLHARHVLWEWGQKSLSEDAELVVSELATNAVSATQAIESVRPVRLWLFSDSSRTLIMIGDASPSPPRRIDPAATDTDGGRGLLLVEALSSNWGWYTTRTAGTAKVVWAELHVPPADDIPADVPATDENSHTVRRT
jgi:anti-sigma regulatory factor (Ser/Thr protein kinase)